MSRISVPLGDTMSVPLNILMQSEPEQGSIARQILRIAEYIADFADLENITVSFEVAIHLDVCDCDTPAELREAMNSLPDAPLTRVLKAAAENPGENYTVRQGK